MLVFTMFFIKVKNMFFYVFYLQIDVLTSMIISDQISRNSVENNRAFSLTWQMFVFKYILDLDPDFGQLN